MNELYHYGVIGMKWGVRRYQNPDGTLTDAGKAHYSTDGTSGSREYPSDDDMQREVRRRNLQRSYDRLEADDANKIPNAVKDVANKAIEITKDTKSKYHQTKKDKSEYKVDVSTLSDEELRQIVNRMNLEQQYDRLADNQYEKDVGKDKVEKYLDYTVDALQVAATVALIIAKLPK